MPEQIPLIEDPDGFEIVRNAIGQILVEEMASQKQQAIDKAIDPTPWDIPVFLERSHPWDVLNAGVSSSLINVWYDNSNTEGAKSNSVNQQSQSVFNVECIASVRTKETETGQLSGDEATQLEVHRIARVVRQLIMHPKWITLGLSNVVGRRWMGTRQAFQPNSGQLPVNNVSACRIQFYASHLETVPFEELTTAEQALVTVYEDPEHENIKYQALYDWAQE
jgi:hypothetical protein